MKKKKLTASTLLLLLIGLLTLISNVTTDSANPTVNNSNYNSKENIQDLKADYYVYTNGNEVYAANTSSSELEIKSENASEVINHVFSSAKEGSIVIIKAGTYNISATLVILKPLHVYAYGAILKVNSNSTQVAVQIGSENSQILGCHSFKGAKILNTAENKKGVGILLYNSHFGTLEDTEIWFFEVAVHSKGSWDYTIRSCIFRVNKVGVKLDEDDEGVNKSNHFRIVSGYIGCDIGIYITGNCQNVIIENVNICDSSNLGAGIWIETAEHTVISQCYFENNPNFDIKIEGKQKPATATQIENCFFYVRKTAIRLENSPYTTVEGCMAVNDNGSNPAFFIDMTENAISLICTHNYILNLKVNLFFGLNGTNVKWNN